MSDKKIPTECNHCNSTNIIHQLWGRTEFWSCLDCKNEVVYKEPDSLFPGYSIWNPKDYGFGTSDFKRELGKNIYNPTNPNIPHEPEPTQYQFILPKGLVIDTNDDEDYDF